MLKKSLVIALDIVIAGYLVLAITAFNQPVEKASVCSEVKIDIKKSAMEGFLNVNEVKSLLQRNNLYPLAQPMQFINTRNIEDVLRKSPFVEKAECYKTQGGHVCIDLTQRMPILRVMSDNGENYYLDEHSNIMPKTRYTSNLIIATGAISRRYAQKVLTPLARYLIGDDFWQNQIEQLNILNDGSLELIPRVGDHIAFLGEPTNIEKKLERLRKFYIYGLNKAGWNQYSYISVEFDNQIVCKRRY